MTSPLDPITHITTTPSDCTPASATSPPTKNTAAGHTPCEPPAETDSFAPANNASTIITTDNHENPTMRANSTPKDDIKSDTRHKPHPHA